MGGASSIYGGSLLYLDQSHDCYAYQAHLVPGTWYKVFHSWRHSDVGWRKVKSDDSL